MLLLDLDQDPLRRVETLDSLRHSFPWLPAIIFVPRSSGRISQMFVYQQMGAEAVVVTPLTNPKALADAVGRAFDRLDR